MWYYICLVLGAAIGWAMCAIFTVAKCDDCRAGRLDNLAEIVANNLEKGRRQDESQSEPIEPEFDDIPF